MKLNDRWSFFILFALITSAVPSWAVEPMGYYNALVAGERESGYRDGKFSKTLFDMPTGLAVDAASSKMYVADSMNHRIRVVDLDNGNESSTLTGTGSAGTEDGSFDKATFNQPIRIVFVGPDKLAVYDASLTGSIRLLDLKTKTVTTLAKNVLIWDMVYNPADNCLYYSTPVSQQLWRMDMKTNVTATVLSADTLVPQPYALALYKGKVCVSDEKTSKVFSLSIAADKDGKTLHVDPALCGQGSKILAMTSSDDILYALQEGLPDLIRVGTPSQPVSLATRWGFFLDDGITGFKPLMYFHQADAVGFIADPNEKRKLYLTRSLEYANGIVSLKDYHFSEAWKAAGPPSAGDGSGAAMDYDYPREKPKNTYRILFSGDSRTNIAPMYDPGSPYDNGWFYSGNRADTIGKQLEFFLNSEAAARGSRIHYEVLEWNRAGHSLSSYCYFELPKLAKNYHVDMVLGLAGSPAYDNYFEEPITKEGIPGTEIDYEYIVKPLSQRLQSPLAKDLYERWKKNHPENTEKYAYPGQDDPTRFFCGADEHEQEDLIEMTGERIRMTREKINSNAKTDFVLFYAPGFDLKDECMSPFWTQLTEKYNIPFIDLTESFNAMRLSYWPVFTRCCSDHYTGYGDQLVAYLVSRYLIDDKLVPFTPEEDKVPK